MREFRHRVAGDITRTWVPETRKDLLRFADWFDRAHARGPVALDTEGTGLDWWDPAFRLRMVQFGDGMDAWVLNWEGGGDTRAAARDALYRGRRWLLHNASYDALVFDARADLPLETFLPRCEDTHTKATLIDPRPAHKGGFGTGLKTASSHWVDSDAPDTSEGLKSAFRQLRHPVTGKPLNGSTGWRYIPSDHPTYLLYGGLDVVLTHRLNTALESAMTRVGVRRKLLPYEYALSRIAATMRRTGMRVDVDYAKGLSEKLASEKEEWLFEAQTNGVENPGSGAQVRARLLEMGEKWRKTTKPDGTGPLSTDKTVLLPMADLDMNWQRVGKREPNPVAEAVLHYKRAEKWGGTYADRFAASGGRLHVDIKTLEARTGRMTVGDGLHQLPSGDWSIRRGILAEPGHRIMSCDFQAVEMRVLAALAGVTRMKEGFVNGGDSFDIHMYTAQLIKGEAATRKDRKLYKGVGFGKVYGGGPDTLSEQSGTPVAEIRRAIAEYERAFPEIRRSAKRWEREARERGYVTITATGRRLPLDRHRLYAVTNYQCQSAGRDLLGTALINAEKAGLLPHMRLPIHDEILASVPEDDAADFAQAFGECMTMSLRGVPITSDPELAGLSWGSAYMKDKDDRPIPELRIANDPFYARHPELAAA